MSKFRISVIAVVSIFILGTTQGQVTTQADLDDIATHIQIKVDVLDNLQFNGGKHLFRVTFNNNGSRSLSGTNWKIFLFSFFVIEADHILSSDGNYILAEGYVLEDSNLRVNHANGCLYSLTPVPGFDEIVPNATREITFFGSLWAISKSDVPPNWYIAADGLAPRVFESTSGNFVGDFTEPGQWKRTKDDFYNPYTPLGRFERYRKTNESPKMKLAIPTPKQIVEYDGSDTLNMNSEVFIVHDSLMNEASFLARSERTTKPDKTSFQLSDVAVKGAINIHLEIDKAMTQKEGYTLQTIPSSKEVRIKGKTETGIFYGIQTFLSMLTESNKIPKVFVRDEPRFEYRGMHVDIARNFQKKTSLIKLMEAMAMYKLNKLHLHATDDEGWRVEIKDLPELTDIGSKRCQSSSQNECLIPQLGSGPDDTTSGSGYLSTQDYKDLLQFAKSRHIEVILEVDMPGHARAAIMAMESRYNKLLKEGHTKLAEQYRLMDPTDTSKYLSVQYFNDNAMSPCLQSTFTFIDKVVKEIKDMHDSVGHPLKIFHFGGDEVARNAWSNSTTCKQLGFSGTTSEVRTNMKKYFAQRVANITSKYGLDLIGWEDGFNEGNGIPFDREAFPNTNVYSNAWDNVWEWGEARRAYNYANAGYKVVMSHATHLYFDHPYEPDPEERGLYWAPRFTDTMKTFGFMPDNLYENIDVSRMGSPLSRHDVCGDKDKKCPALHKTENIIGMQGNLWSETVLTEENFYYMVFPRLLALAERAWYKADWEIDLKNMTRHISSRNDWEDFAYTLGKRELNRLDNIGIHYRVPPPGGRVTGNKASIESEFKELQVEYSQDDGKSWTTVPTNWDLPNKYTMMIRTKSADGKRHSRSVKFNPVNQEMIDYLASELDIRYEVLDNLVDSNKSFLQRIRISNKGTDTVLPGDWSIFFYQIRSINNLKPLLLSGCGMLLEHVSGSLYKLTPDRKTFASLAPRGQNVLNCDFHARYWSVATTDNMPNWYVWSDGTEAKVVQSTAGEGLNFVGPYDTKNKWKRYPDDTYDPFLPRTRYVINNNVEDLGVVDEGTYVIPTPVKMTQNKNRYVNINSLDGWVVQNSDYFANEVKQISEMFNVSIISSSRSTRIIKVVIGNISVLQNGSKTEAYHLDVDASSNVVTIRANDKKGVYYAIQTMKRLSIAMAENTHKIYETHIEDEPRFQYRGLFIDVGRNFHTKDEIKTILDVMSVYKLNRFVFHLSEDEGWRLEIPGLEELTEIGSKRCHDLQERTCTSSQLGSGPTTNNSGSGFYTVDDYKEILTYANDRNIKVIPEFDMPGHARAAIIAMKERKRIYDLRRNVSFAEMYMLHDANDKSQYMSVQWFVDNAINPCIDSTYTFVEHVVAEVQKMHSGIQDLEIFSFGGDEVAAGAWKQSPKCIELMKSNVGIDNIADIKEYFARRVSGIVGTYGLDVSAWEDGLMHGKNPYNVDMLVPKGRKAYTNVWDNVWEKGSGDRSYRMANAGYKVVLALATHLYFDHPYEPDPAERGYYWATRYTDTRKTFGFVPENIYLNADVKRNGSPLTTKDICGGETCYQLAKPENIIGMMGLVWSETSRTKDQLHDRYFPRMLALAERAWHKASWEDETNKDQRMNKMNDDWILFANRLGYRELKYLDDMGINYRVPVPGAKQIGDEIQTNTAFPGLVVEYSDYNQKYWKSGSISSSRNNIHLRTRSADGFRTSRVISLSRTTSTANYTRQSVIYVLLFFSTQLYLYLYLK